jgi:hypothetical protein
MAENYIARMRDYLKGTIGKVALGGIATIFSFHQLLL